MKSKCGISSHCFFSVAALTGCISVIVNMSLTDPPLESGGITASREFKFGPTFVVKPKGKHQATIVWLHGLGDDGSSWSQLLETLPLPNIKWICPTSPVQPLTLFDGLSTTTWFDIIDKSEDASQDEALVWVQQLRYTLQVALLVENWEMALVTLPILTWLLVLAAGFRVQSSSFHRHCFSILVILLTYAKLDLSNKVGGYKVEGHAASLPILLCHGRGDDVVHFRYGKKSAEKLTSAGFRNLTLKSFHSLGHYIIPEEIDEVSSWLISNLELEGES
ncbi:Phospholipase/carboxylesterase/thioesterase [Cynara cardunculus var. scolymus]|uniref:Phospholipase/carboxylesterase/thioesterase n=1 Tax=Cynara cardunculus var. scolymus TaxID=59895 RepID=A0A124SCH3_CYNCS|nr:Phospholipase/carboxylesterase/thioesterase [Cynara cardunculus var. scolymus]